MKHIFGILIASCIVGVLCPSAQADTLLSMQPPTVVASPGTVGDAFDVVLTNNGPSSISVQSFLFQVSVTDTDITLTGADFSPGAFTYIFAGDSFDVINGFTLNTLGPGQTMDGSDGTNDGVGINLTSGQSFALGEVLFNVSPTAAKGSFAVSFTGGALGNNLSNPAGGPINIDNFSAGTIDIVPEPSSTVPLLVAFACLGLLRVKIKQSAG